MEDLDKIENIEEIETVEDFVNILFKKHYLLKLTGINPNCGIQGRLRGVGTNATDKRTSLTENDKSDLKQILTRLEAVVKKVKKTL